MNKEIEEKVIKITANILSLNIKDININSHFINDLGADSLDLVELIMAFEDEFDIMNIKDIDAEKMFSIKNSINYIEKALKEKL